MLLKLDSLIRWLVPGVGSAVICGGLKSFAVCGCPVLSSKIGRELKKVVCLVASSSIVSLVCLVLSCYLCSNRVVSLAVCFILSLIGLFTCL